MHHLAGTPNAAVAGEIQLANDGAIHLGMVAHNDAGFVRQVLQALDGGFGIEEPDQPADQAEAKYSSVWSSFIRFS